MNYHISIVNFRGRLLGRGAYFENLTFGGALIGEWALIRSFTLMQNDKVFITSFKSLTRQKLILFNISKCS